MIKQIKKKLKTKVIVVFFLGILFILPTTILKLLSFVEYFKTHQRLNVRQDDLKYCGDSYYEETEKIFNEYESTISFQRISKFMQYSTPEVTVILWGISLLLILCCRNKEAKSRYISLTDLSNPFKIISVLTFKEYTPFGICGIIHFYIALSITSPLIAYALINTVTPGFQAYEIKRFNDGYTSFYEEHQTMMDHIKFVQKQYDNKSPFCSKITFDQIFDFLDADKSFYNNYVFYGDYSLLSKAQFYVSIFFDVFSGLSTLINILIFVFLPYWAEGFSIYENGEYIPFTYSVKRKGVKPL